MATGSVGVISLVLGTFMCMMTEVDGTWSWEWNRDNHISPMNRHIRSRVPHVGVRRSIFDKFWSDATPNNPFLTNRPSAPHVRPDLTENEFVFTDDDYEDYVRDSHWLPQTQRHHAKQRSKSLEGLEHILEEKLVPFNESPAIVHHKNSLADSSHKDVIEKKQKSKQRKHRQRLASHKIGHTSLEEEIRAAEPESLHHLPSFTHEAPISNNGHFSKDLLHDFQEQFGMPEHFTNPKQFPKDFITSEEFPSEFELGDSLSNDHLHTGPFANELEGQEPFQEHLLLSPLPNHDFSSHDHLLDLDSHQAFSEVDLPQIFPDLGILEKIGQPESVIPQERLGHFGLPNANTNHDILPEDGEGLEWLPPALHGLNLPSHGHILSALEEQTMSKEAHRDACHARNLHACGSRLIDEFAFGPDNPDKCRIREEFLDCMEQVMKLPCELHGKLYSHEGTKLIRDKIKTLLWSVQGCILGYST